MTLDLLKLRYAVQLAREGSFTAAGDALHLSQSALTRSIQSLERELGVTLFERGRLGVRVTKAGAEVIDAADALLRHSNDVAERFEQLSSENRQVRVRIGVGAISALAFLPDLLPMLSDLDLAVHVIVDTNSRLISMLDHDEIDFFVGGIPLTQTYVRTKGLIAHRFTGGSVNLVVRKNHPLLMTKCRPEDIQQYPVAGGTFLEDTLQPGILDGAGLQRPSVHSDDYGFLGALAQKSDYIVIGSRVFVERRPEMGLAVLPVKLPTPTETEWVLLRSSQFGLSSIAEQVFVVFREFIAEALTMR